MNMTSPTIPTQPASTENVLVLPPTQHLPLQDSFYCGNQLVLAEHKPNPHCKYCKGAGYTGTTRVNSKPKRVPVGPNESCVCSSGKKYKKCHGPIVESMRQAGQTILACGCVGHCEIGSNPMLTSLKEKFEGTFGTRPTVDSEVKGEFPTELTSQDTEL